MGRNVWLLSLSLCMLLGVSLSARAQNAVNIGTAYADPGEINIGYRLMLGGDDNLNATCRTRYRQITEETWHEALAPTRFSTHITPSEDGTGGTDNVIDKAEKPLGWLSFLGRAGRGIRDRTDTERP